MTKKNINGIKSKTENLRGLSDTERKRGSLVCFQGLATNLQSVNCRVFFFFNIMAAVWHPAVLFLSFCLLSLHICGRLAVQLSSVQTDPASATHRIHLKQTVFAKWLPC